MQQNLTRSNRQEDLLEDFYGAAPDGCAKRYCFTKATREDEHSNAGELDISELVRVLWDLDHFKSDRIELTPEILEKIFVMIPEESQLAKFVSLANRDKEALKVSHHVKRVRCFFFHESWNKKL